MRRTVEIDRSPASISAHVSTRGWSVSSRLGWSAASVPRTGPSGLSTRMHGTALNRQIREH